jgi:hypothetical protein
MKRCRKLHQQSLKQYLGLLTTHKTFLVLLFHEWRETKEKKPKTSKKGENCHKWAQELHLL